MRPCPVRFLKQGPAMPGRDPSAAPEAGLDQGGSGNKLVCRACGHEITRTGARMSVDDSHAHVFSNPAGYVFEIGCFRNAPGCLSEGPTSTEFSWFPGFSWQVALCGGCRGLMGWRYRPVLDAGAGFFGLILPHLDEVPDDD